jgi:nucleoid-associated protein YgaU
MGLISFIKEAGEKLFGHGEAKAAQEAAAQDASAENIARLNQAASDAIKTYLDQMGLSATSLEVAFSDGEVTVYGMAPDQATREKIIVAAGNVQGVSAVHDEMTTDTAEPEGTWYTVVKGDTLWKISANAYGNGALYEQIFEANRPMLSHPDKIYPGQVLRIPHRG